MDDLKTLDMSLSFPRKGFNKLLKEKQEQLGELQREIRDKGIPVIIVVDGWFTSGKSEIINSIVQSLDSRGYKLNSGFSESADAKRKPFFWQYWRNIPEQGKISLFEESWYHKAMLRNTAKDAAIYQPSLAYSDINSFETQLIQDNNLVIKLFLHVSQKQLQKRFKNTKKFLNGVGGFGRKKHFHAFYNLEVKDYDKMLSAYEDMLRQSNTAISPWFTIEADNMRYAQLKIFDILIKLLTDKLENATRINTIYVPNTINLHNNDPIDKLDLTKTLNKDVYERELEKYQNRLKELQIKLVANKIPMVIAFEGSDAAGKGGAIRRIISALDPRGYYVVPISAPKGAERTHNYLWRFWCEMPSKGQVALFDRTWYGRVLVERVEKFATEQEWTRAYSEINELESLLVHDDVVLVKFWLQIDKDEQLRRFKAREESNLKKWKITDEDWRNREKWDEYAVAVRDMLVETSTSYAPWTIVSATCKYYARIKVLKTIVSAIEAKLDTIVLSKSVKFGKRWED